MLMSLNYRPGPPALLRAREVKTQRANFSLRCTALTVSKGYRLQDLYRLSLLLGSLQGGNTTRYQRKAGETASFNAAGDTEGARWDNSVKNIYQYGMPCSLWPSGWLRLKGTLPGGRGSGIAGLPAPNS